jgi:uncharacterized protein
MKFSPKDAALKERILIDIPENAYALQVFTDPMLSHYANAVSMVIDLLEQYAINAIAQALPKLESIDSDFQQQARLFVLQERNHSAGHRSHQRFLKSQGYEHAADELRDFVKSMRWRLNSEKEFEPLLFASVAFEHITTTISRYFMHIMHDAMTTANPAALYLYSYHAAEELEHKGICFDAYQYLFNVSPVATEESRARFAGILLQGKKIMVLALQSILNTENKLHPNTHAFDKRAAHQYLKGHPIFTLDGYFESFNDPDFHPWNTDDHANVSRWDNEWRALLEEKINPQT